MCRLHLGFTERSVKGPVCPQQMLGRPMQLENPNMRAQQASGKAQGAMSSLCLQHSVAALTFHHVPLAASASPFFLINW